MLCGPYSAAHVTGCDYREIVTRIVARRERLGERNRELTTGTTASEVQEALDRLGWRMRRVFRNRRVRLKELARRVRRGRWIFRQNGHFFGVRSATELRQQARRHPNALVMAGWLIHRERAALARERGGNDDR